MRGERLVGAMRSIEARARSSEILDTLVRCAGREAPRVGVLLVRDGELRGWRFIGFGAGSSSRALRMWLELARRDVSPSRADRAAVSSDASGRRGTGVRRAARRP